MSGDLGFHIRHFSPTSAGEFPARRDTRSRAEPDRLVDIDRARGFAILLVVLGHIVARRAPLDNKWYLELQTAIYTFHMPFFMYLAGVIFSYGDNHGKLKADYGAYLLKRAKRLLLPFVMIGLIILIGKLLAGELVFVDNNPGGFVDGLTAMIWDTDHSPATALWFIFVLFCYCALTPPLLRLTGGLIWPVLILAGVLHFVAAPPLVYADRIASFYVFFVIGVAVGRHFPAALSFVDRTYPIFCILFVTAIMLVLSDTYIDMAALASSVLAIPALHGIIRAQPLNRSDLLRWLGKFSFIIYLFNTIFIGLAKGMLLLIVPSWDGINFLIYFPTLMAAGLIGPVALKHFALGRVPALGRLTD